MAEAPKLTASQAALLRLRGGRNDLRDTVELARLGHLDGMGVRITNQGRAALAAYDAEQHRAIRVQAMREIRVKVETLASAFRKLNDPFPQALAATLTIIEVIDEKIAKEESNG